MSRTRPNSEREGVPSRPATERRAVILNVLAGVEGFVTAPRLHMMISARGMAISLSTIYRTLTAAESEGLVEVLHRGGIWGRVYRYVPPVHDHHLVCTACGDSVPFTCRALEDWFAGIGPRYGFRDVRHAISVAGTCAQCVPTEDA
ncbi:Fur family transcriptional regulator [Streptomyces sp. NPDC051217]|uniref:Fur family transcriptional regulator n=1 Tax=Streptomyces sp. NPDC051217 TaxID=3365644 RepID=UPI0037884E6F